MKTFGLSEMECCEKIRRYILAHSEEILADVLMLAEHQSPSSSKEYADRCADALEALMEARLGVKPTAVFPQESNGRHLYYEIGSSEKKALLLAHYDTVWNVDALPLKREGNVLAGPGVLDMKCGIAAGIWALKALQETGGLTGIWGLFFNSDEETGSRSSVGCFEPVAKQYPTALILEPATAEGAVKLGRKGVGMFEITVHGKAAHAGNDYLTGRSAILEAARLTEALFAMSRPEDGTTVNVGVISGGTKRNVVAAEAKLSIDVRVTTKAESDRITEAIYALQPHQDGITLDISGGLNRPPFPRNDATDALFAIAKEAAAELGSELHGITVGGGSDGNFTAAWGIPTLDGLGPIGSGAHAATEHILVAESLERIAVLGNFLGKL